MKRMKTRPTISLLCLYLGCLALVLLRWIHIFTPQVVVITPEITSHISNFALSLMLCLLIGNLLLSYGAGRRAVILLCGLVMVANLLYEAFLPFLNTPDLVDAVYGITAAALGMMYLLWLEHRGFQPPDTDNKTR